MASPRHSPQEEVGDVHLSGGHRTRQEHYVASQRIRMHGYRTPAVPALHYAAPVWSTLVRHARERSQRSDRTSSRTSGTNRLQPSSFNSAYISG